LEVVRLRQSFPRPRELKIKEKVRQELASLKLEDRLEPGARVAVTAGSRGIANIVTILKEVVGHLKSIGAEPFLVSSMGSHGGATIEGQREMLSHLGITEETVGAELLIGTETVVIGETETGQQVHCDAYAAEADGILVVNRIKMHTTFRGELESGLFKMMAVGLGKEPGATSFHSLGQQELAPSLLAMGRVFLAEMPVVGGLAILENAYEETAELHGLLPEVFETEERRLQARAKELFPRLPVDNLDVLVVDEIGKNIAGTGMDSNVIGRMRLDGEPDFYPPKIQRIVVLGLSEGTGNNGYGIGLADLTTRRIAERLDHHMMNVNALATGFLPKAFTPMVMENDEQAIGIAISSVGGRTDRLCRIKNTLELHELELSPALVEEIRPDVDYEVISDPYEWKFDDDGRLPPLEIEPVV